MPQLISPQTGQSLDRAGDALTSATGERYPVRDGIPRFVEDPEYARSFGEQWKRYRRVQLDSVTRKPLSRERFYSGTGWSSEELKGQHVLEVGCGAGRFTEILLDADAEVWAVDATSAVAACRDNHAPHPRLNIAQADLFTLPFSPESFDRVFCYGVLQHTPDPGRAFHALVRHVRPGGAIAADVYRVPSYVDRWSAKRLWRPLTTRLPSQLLRRIVEWYVPRWLPIDTRLARVPRLGRFLVAIVPCWNYAGLLPLTYEEHVAWAILDTFDALAPKYDIPQTLADVQEWCRAAGLVDVHAREGGNGIVFGGRRPAT